MMRPEWCKIGGPVYKEKSCQRCGIGLGAVPSRTKWCDECRKIKALERSKEQSDHRRAEREKARQAMKRAEKKDKRPGSVVQIAKAANAAGMSYGQYVAATERGAKWTKTSF